MPGVTEMATQVGTDAAGSGGPTAPTTAAVGQPLTRAFEDNNIEGLGDDLGDMTGALGPRRGIASFLEGSKDAGF